MKKIMILFMAIFCIQILTAETITRTYNFEIPEFISNDGYTELNYQNCRNFGEEGYPSLPYFAANILLLQNQEIEEVKIISSEYYPVQDGITIKPAERQFPISSGKHLDYKVIPNETIYNSSKSFPDNIIDNTSTHFLCGHSIASFTVCPVSYKPSEKQVDLLKSITVEIETSITGKALDAERFLQNSIKIEKRIQDIVDNPEMLYRYSYSQQSRDDEEDILLITNSTLLPSFSDYIEFKEETGFIVATVTTEYINTNYTGADLQEKIRNCIIDHYTNNGISYVILGGDSSPVTPSDNIIPHRGFYDNAYGENENDIPADIYYSNLDGNWNTDGDTHWGEPGEDDLYSEVGIGRICVDSDAEILNHTNKLEMYQDSPVVADLEKALMLGELLWDDPTWGGDYKDEVADGSSMHGYTTAGVSANFTITRLYERDASYDKYDIFSQFNTTGVNLLNHLGHSNVTYNMLMYNSDLTTSNFTNNGVSRGYVIGYSQGCYNGSFDNRDSYGSYSGTNCFAEQITTIATAEVASIGNSRYGWGAHSSTDGGSQYFDRQFYDAIFGEGITAIGTANADSKEDNIGYIGNDPIRWCTYELNLFGDPSMDIWTAVPVAMNVSHPASVFTETSSIAFITDAPYARIGLIQNGVMIGRAVTGASGDVTVNLFAPISDTNDISVSIIGHNKIRHQGTIVVVSDQAYVIYNSYIINDPSGNNDGMADYGESVTLDMTLENVGNHDALSVNAILSSTDSFINITDNSQSYGTILQTTTSTQSDAFAFTIANNIPDQQIINFDLEVTGTSSRDTWNSSFQITVNAPELTIDDMIIDDSLENNNGRLDPGEIVDLIIPTNNDGHSNSPSAIGTISCTNGYITINGSDTHNFGIINASSTENAVFNITVASDAPIGTNVSFDYNVTAGSYSADETFNRSIGLILEDFETGNFASFPWESAGSANWTIVTELPYEGIYCAESGDISNSQTSELILTADVTADGTISFYRKVSSESSYDYLQFYIDGSLQDQWAGEVSWSEVSYLVTAGNRTFKWVYDKDGSVSNGSDCAWVDYIVFPAVYFPGPADITVNPELFSKVLQTNMSTSDNLIIGNTGDAQLEYTATINYSSRRTNHVSSTNSVISNIIKEPEVRNELETKRSPSPHDPQNQEPKSIRDRDYTTIGAGSSISGTYDTNITPFGTYYHDGQNQYLFTASELSTAGLIAGDINTVGWNIASDAAQTMNGFNVELKHTTATSVTGFETGFTNCYYVTWTASAGWNDIPFSTPFNWDGTSNLLVKICFDNTSYTSNSTCYYDTYTAMNGWAYNDNTSGCSDPYEGTSDSRPQIRFAGSTFNWLTLNGGSSVIGSIPGGSPDDVIIVGFNSTDLTEGVYTADIVISSNDPDESPFIVLVTLNVSDQLATPVNVQIQTISGDVHLSWDVVSSATKYHVFRSTDPYSGFTRITPYPSGTATNSYIDTPSNEKYFYYITAE
jgi:hypothetical protein